MTTGLITSDKTKVFHKLPKVHYSDTQLTFELIGEENSPETIKLTYMYKSKDIAVRDLGEYFVNKDENQTVNEQEVKVFMEVIFNMIAEDKTEINPIESAIGYFQDKNLQTAFHNRKSDRTRFEVRRKEKRSHVVVAKKVIDRTREEDAVEVVDKWRTFFDDVPRDEEIERARYCPLNKNLNRTQEVVKITRTYSEFDDREKNHNTLVCVKCNEKSGKKNYNDVSSDINDRVDYDDEVESISNRKIFTNQIDGYHFKYNNRQYILVINEDLPKPKKPYQTKLTVYDAHNRYNYDSMLIGHNFNKIDEVFVRSIIDNLVVHLVPVKVPGYIYYIGLENWEQSKDKTSIIFKPKKIVPPPMTPIKKDKSDQITTTENYGQTIQTRDMYTQSVKKTKIVTVRKTRKVHRRVTKSQYDRLFPGSRSNSADSKGSSEKTEEPKPEPLSDDILNLLGELGLDPSKLFLVIKIQSKVKTFIARMRFKKEMKNVFAQFYIKVENQPELKAKVIIKKVMIREKIAEVHRTFSTTRATTSLVSQHETTQKIGQEKEVFKIQFEIHGIEDQIDEKKLDKGVVQDTRVFQWLNQLGKVSAFKDHEQVTSDYSVQRVNKDGLIDTIVLGNRYVFKVAHVFCEDKIHRLWALGYFREVVRVGYYENQGFVGTCQDYNLKAIQKAKAENIKDYKAFLNIRARNKFLDMHQGKGGMNFDTNSAFMTSIGESMRMDSDPYEGGKIVWQTTISYQNRQKVKKEYIVSLFHKKYIAEKTSIYAKLFVREKGQHKYIQHQVKALQCHQAIYRDKKAPYKLTLEKLQDDLVYEEKYAEWKQFAKSIRVVGDKTILNVNSTFVDAFVKDRLDAM